MARARNIKPGFFKNEDLGTADPFVSLLFAGLWTLADKAGILEDRPLRIKAELFPYRENFDINGYLTVLVSLHLIHRYTVDELRLIQVANFSKHQNPHHTEKASEYPAYSTTCQNSVIQPLFNGATPADSLIPDSLIPDSLIPDSLIPDSRKRSPRFNPADCVLPTSIDSDKWAEWIAYRKGRKLATSELTAKKQIDFLADCAGKGIDAGKVIDDSIRQGWQGLFEPKQQQASKPGYQSIHDQRANTIAILTGKKSNERTSNAERDITGESFRVA